MKLGRSYLSVKAVKKLLKDGWELSVYVNNGYVSEVSFFQRSPSGGPHCGRGFSYMCGNPCPQPRLWATVVNCLMAVPDLSIECKSKKQGKVKQ